MRRNAIRDRIIDTVLDIVIYGSFLTMTLWGILKGLGVINTPALVQQLPLITGGIGLLGFTYRVGRYVERIEQRFTHFDLKFNHIDKDIEQVRTDIAFVKQRV